MILKKPKNTFLICVKGFSKIKLNGNDIASQISKDFNVDFKKPTWTVIWLPIPYLLFKYLQRRRIFYICQRRDHISGRINGNILVPYCTIYRIVLNVLVPYCTIVLYCTILFFIPYYTTCFSPILCYFETAMAILKAFSFYSSSQ